MHNMYVCACVVKKNGFVVLVDTIDTSGHSHSTSYLEELKLKICKETMEEKYECKIRCLVTDNAFNMKRMRNNVQGMNGNNIISYGCSAHLLKPSVERCKNIL